MSDAPGSYDVSRGGYPEPNGKVRKWRRRRRKSDDEGSIAGDIATEAAVEGMVWGVFHLIGRLFSAVGRNLT